MALILFVAQAVFTVVILVLGTMAAAGMLSPEERAARVARRVERKRKARETSSSTGLGGGRWSARGRRRWGQPLVER